MARIIIGYIGDETTFATLSIRYLGSRIELVSSLTSYSALNGRYLHAELAREFATDGDEAEAIACDMEWQAQDELKVMDIDFWKSPCGWPEALLSHFDKARRAYEYSCAISHDAALIAAE